MIESVGGHGLDGSRFASGTFFQGLELEEYAGGLNPPRILGRALSRRKSPEWYPIFESHFLFGTVLGDFSLESPVIGPDRDFRIGKSRTFVRAESACIEIGSQNAIQG